MSTNKSLHIKITGQVQAVGFRYSTIELAQKLNLTGWVRNSKDGEVEILAQGQEDNLKKLLKWSCSGPRNAKVESVEFEWRENKNKFDSFKVKY